MGRWTSLVWALGWTWIGCSSNPAVIEEPDAFFDDGETPFLLAARMACQFYGSGAEKWVWEVRTDDAQGSSTILQINDISAHANQGLFEVFRKPVLACSPGGRCMGSLQSRLTGIRCENHDEYIFRAYIGDVDGHVYDQGFVIPWDGGFID